MTDLNTSVERRAALSEADAARLAWEQYGLRATATALPGEMGQNFRLRADDGRETILKISDPSESWDCLDFQVQALDHLAAHAPTLPVPRVLRDQAGRAIVPLDDDEEHYARLLTYLPGRLLVHVNPHPPALLRDLGRVLGKMDAALQSFSHPAMRRDLKWDLAGAGWAWEHLAYLADPPRRALVERFMALYEAEAATRLPDLRASVIYNDGNDYNVLVGGDARDLRVAGVFDFGDMTYSQTVGEIAIAAAYAMLDKPDPLAAAAHVVAGYHAACPLTEAELAALYPLIVARLCVSVVNSAYCRAVDPANGHMMINEAPAWALLERLAAVSPTFAHFTFRDACGLPPSPTSAAVVAWLAAHAADIGRVVAADLRTAPITFTDLGVGSLDLANPIEWADTELLTARIFEDIRLSGAAASIGRYGEVRGVYTGDAFYAQGNDGPEWRTMHIGVDVFMPVGEPVYAPLDGVVHSFTDDAVACGYGPVVILQHDPPDAPRFYTLYGHLTRESLTGLAEGMPVRRGDQIGAIGAAEVNGGWPPHLHLQILTDLLERRGEFPGVARVSQQAVWMSVCPDPNLILGIPESRFPPSAMDAAQITAIRAQALGPSLSTSYDRPLHIVRGWMQYLYDADGRKYLDAVNNVPHVGHSHPKVVRAGQRQMAVLNTNTRYLHANLARYIERLTATLPDPLRVCYFVTSGSEANELALRIARTVTGHDDTIVVEVGYHGNTTGLIDVSPYKHAGPGGRGAPPHVRAAPIPDAYRGRYRRDDPQAGAKYAAHVGEIAAEMGQNGGVAAFIAESAMGTGGQIILPDGYLAAAYRHVRAAGGLCIADEVQVGFGRAGDSFWMFETQGVVPDIVTLGKPIGNGHPMGAVITTPAIAQAFANGMEYFNTFGGNPVSCAIGLAVLDVIEAEGLQAQALRVGQHLLAELRPLMDRHAVVGDVRGHGMFVGVELVRDRETLEPAGAEAAYVANRLRERGILLSTDGPYHNVLKIKPPLVFDEHDADRLVAELDRILAEDFVRGAL
ncbi:MAG: aminotransferase class III-fold pyridoxal phosphate-dependent enzyme [Anaerolineae bacterium]